MKSIKRNKCTITGEDLIPFYEIKNFPILMHCTEQNKEKDLFLDLKIEVGKEFGCIQISSLVPTDILYSSQHGAGSVGNIWFEHHQAFADFIYSSIPDNIFEIGGYHGILSEIYISKYGKIKWIILDPAPNPIPHTEAIFIKGFFNVNTKNIPQECTVIHSHVLEHLHEPELFISHLSSLLKKGQKHIFSFPNMNAMLNEKHGNMLNFEHTICLQEEYIDYLLLKNGFAILKKQYFKQNHSIFYMTEKSCDKCDNIDQLRWLVANNKTLLKNYINYFQMFSLNVNKKLDLFNSKIYLFGAHITSQFLIAMGLNTEKLSIIIDNDNTKQGKRLYGTNLFVSSPKILSYDDMPVVILVPGAYNDEIKNDITSNINKNVIFLES